MITIDDVYKRLVLYYPNAIPKTTFIREYGKIINSNLDIIDEVVDRIIQQNNNQYFPQVHIFFSTIMDLKRYNYAETQRYEKNNIDKVANLISYLNSLSSNGNVKINNIIYIMPQDKEKLYGDVIDYYDKHQSYPEVQHG